MFQCFTDRHYKLQSIERTGASNLQEFARLGAIKDYEVFYFYKKFLDINDILTTS